MDQKIDQHLEATVTGIDMTSLIYVREGLQSVGYGLEVIGWGIIIFALAYLIWVFRSTSRKRVDAARTAQGREGH
jgi:hypothetical protein